MSEDTDRPESHEEIMWATHQALCTHGYADLTLRKIAAESSKSHSLLAYHYDTKDDLIEAYLDFLIELLHDVIEDADGTHPHPLERLDEFLDYFTVGTEVYPASLQVAFLELQMMALRNEGLRQKLAEHDRDNFELLAEILNDGIEEGVFRADIDPDACAKFILLSVMGASEHETTGGIEGLTDDVRTFLSTEGFEALLVDSSPDCDSPPS